MLPRILRKYLVTLPIQPLLQPLLLLALSHTTVQLVLM
ncbi:hypothetical protein CKA32_006837 [Geitlerinema sp. FC II]|nr:hypothetical protein CKA32_006837 [Geitlerinema sp. FC II]